MLLTNRRHRLLFAALAGVELSWFLPFIALILVYWAPRSPHAGFETLALFTAQPFAAFGLLWAILLLYMLLTDWLNQRGIDSPIRQLTMLAAMLITTLAAIMALLHPPAAWFTPLPWQGLFSAVFDFNQGLRPELILLLLNFFLWFRVAAYTDRNISFFGVGFTFRVALLLSMVGNGLLTTLGGQPPGLGIQYFVLTILCGLLAAAMARIDDKAQGVRNSTGALLPWTRVAHILLFAAIIVLLALALSQIITPDLLRSVLGWTAPFWQFLGLIFGQILIWIMIALTPFFEWLAALIQARLQEVPPTGPFDPLAEENEFISLGEIVDRSALLRYCLVTGIVAGAIGLLWLFFVRTRRRDLSEEDEDAAREESRSESGGLNLGLDRLRTWLGLLRRYGLGTQLLAAVSVENIYANVLRLAAAKGVHRGRAVPPDRFLPQLTALYPDHRDALQRITIAYMRVYYGSREITAEELQQIRADYAALRAQPDTPRPTGPPR